MSERRSEALVILSMTRFCILKFREKGYCTQQDLRECGFFEHEVKPFYVTAYSRALRKVKQRKENKVNAILTTTEVKTTMTESLYQMLVTKHSKDRDDLKHGLSIRGFGKTDIQQFFSPCLDEAESLYSQRLLKAI